MSDIIHATSVGKRFGKSQVLQGIDLSVSKGEIIGLIGPNGAGKTTLLKSILGLAPCDGELEVLGMSPRKDRKKLMERISFIADTAILPDWIKVEETMAFVAAIHPKFDKGKAREYLSSTNIPLKAKVRELSKGMVTKLHLSLVMSIDSELLVLDEPTLGLDIVKRKEFYQQLLGDYFDDQKTIVITTHQVEEIENLITRAIFINDGEIVLDQSVEEIAETFVELVFEDDQYEQVVELKPLHISKGIRSSSAFFISPDRDQLAELGETKVPTLADLFVAKVSQ